MKKSLILYSFLVLLQPACKKDQHTGNAPNTWTLNGKNFQAVTVNYISSGDRAAITYSATGILDFMFSTAPTAGGEMLISHSGDPNTIIIEVSQGTGFPFAPIIYRSAYSKPGCDCRYRDITYTVFATTPNGSTARMISHQSL
jgi:hypothetical protein